MEELDITASISITFNSLKENSKLETGKYNQQYFKTYYQKNKDRIKEYTKLYYRDESNTERCKQHARKQYEANKEQIKEKRKNNQKQWYERNKEQQKQKNKERYERRKKEKKENVTPFRKHAKIECTTCGAKVSYYSLKRHQTSFRCKQLGTIEFLRNLIAR